MAALPRRDGESGLLLGVRTARNAPLVFVAAHGINACPGARVRICVAKTRREI